MSPLPPMQRARQLVLAGTGPAHVHLLAALCARPLPGAQITLLAHSTDTVHDAMLSGYVAGHYALEQCQVALAPFVQQTGLRWLRRNVSTLDAQQQTLELDDGSTLHYDWLSLNLEPQQERAHIEQTLPGAREHALFVHPTEVFCALWPKVVTMGLARALRVAVIASGVQGIELALALRARLPNAAVTLVCGHTPLTEGLAPRVAQWLQALLRERKVTVLQDHATAVLADAVALGCGAHLACDVPLLANATQVPAWLSASALARDAHGGIATDASLRSASHPSVFATPGDASGVHLASTLEANLRASVAGNPLQAPAPAARRLQWIACGDASAIATWGNYSARGRALGWLKQWLELRFVALYSRNVKRGATPAVSGST